MKVTFNWLKQYVDFDWPPDDLAERLTMLGIEVEAVEKLGAEFQGIVVAQVLTCDRHPNADKLSVCRVNDGHGERQIVCGAHNFKVGDKVPLILPGSSLPAKPGQQPLTIKAGRIRGIDSQGMMCSPQELGLPGETEGLLILGENAKVGQPFGEYLGRKGPDVLYDLEITPNRPDLNSVVGIAREISALTGNPLKTPQISYSETGPALEGQVGVKLEDAELCPRYTARLVRGVKIAPSPGWLKAALEGVGIRSINNVVDVTNFVMLEVGQPLHAFDFNLLTKTSQDPHPMIVVRRAAEGEKFMTLDGKEHTMRGSMLLIADASKAVALAGVMGGHNSEINLNTTDVLIESAYFKPQSVRATSKRLGLRTESSYRFERGCDIGICDWASRRAVQLILETAGGEAARGVVDAYPRPVEPKHISLRPYKVNELLGIELRPEGIENYLGQLGLKVSGRKPRPVGAEPASSEPVSFQIPTFRVDLKREVDLIEEVVRLHGIENVPATAPRGAVGSNGFDAIHDQLAEARQLLIGLGLFEAQGQTLISDEAARRATDDLAAPLANPLSSDMNVLRTSLLPGLLDALRHNLNHKHQDVGLFEIGRVFSLAPAEAAKTSSAGGVQAIREARRLAIALTGRRGPVFWTGSEREARLDIYDLKGALEEFFERFGLRGISYARRTGPSSLFLESAHIQLGKSQLGQLGQLLPALRKTYDLPDPVFLAEVDIGLLLARRSTVKSFRALPAFPSIRRDVAMVVPEQTTHEAVIQVVKQAKPQNLESTELFDIFRGKNVPDAHKSMAYAFTYRSPERTLTDTEVNAAHEKLVASLKQRLGAVVRE